MHFSSKGWAQKTLRTPTRNEHHCELCYFRRRGGTFCEGGRACRMSHLLPNGGKATEGFADPLLVRPGARDRYSLPSPLLPSRAAGGVSE